MVCLGNDGLWREDDTDSGVDVDPDWVDESFNNEMDTVTDEEENDSLDDDSNTVSED